MAERYSSLVGRDSWLVLGDKSVNVVGVANLNKKWKNEYTERKGYIAEDSLGDAHVWIAHAHEPSMNEQMYPCFWEGEDGNIVISNPSDELYEKSSIEFIKIRSLDTISRESEEVDDAEYDRKMKALIRKSASMTLPVLKKADDFLKLIVKTVMRKKMISLNGMPSTGASQPHLFANMRSALLNDTKMSTSYFRQWMEVDSFDVVIYATDSGADPDHRMNVTIRYDSRTDMITYIYPDGHEEDDQYLTYLHSIHDEDEPEDTVEVIESSEGDDE